MVRLSKPGEDTLKPKLIGINDVPGQLPSFAESIVVVALGGLDK